MDDVPAGPASPESRRPLLSVVIPVHNGGQDFERCLLRLRDSDRTDYELVVVDDGSTDSSAALAERFGAIVVRNPTRNGPAQARNTGARAATAPLVFFLDADVAVHRDTLSKVVARFEADPGLSALFGSYDDQPTAPGVVSQYRNLLHHYVHQQGEFVADARPARTFWTGCGAIRKQAFLDFGGFDPKLYDRPAIEDIELGYRLTDAGCRVLLARDVLATHMKRWTLASVVRTDIFQRGVPWMLLMKRSKTAQSDLNVRPDQRASVAAAGLLGLSLAASAWFPGLLAVAAAALAAIVGLNFGFYRFLARRRGWGFALASIPLHYVYFCCCGLSVVIALGLWHLAPRRAGALEMEREPRDASTTSRRADPADERVIPRPSAARARRPARWTRPRA
jgi:glycosyltransferase involved in cell wall biosynthesis